MSDDAPPAERGPRDLNRHSKWPNFLRLHGSVIPSMLVPLTFVAAWATAIQLISVYTKSGPIKVNTVLLTVLGFVVALALSFRSSTAYERYSEGRKYWQQLTTSCHILARVIWINSIERPGEQGRQDLLAKITALNYIIAFTVALKHRLRFEPYTSHADLDGLVGHLATFAKDATDKNAPPPRKPGPIRAAAKYLDLPFASSNPRKQLKKASAPVGNLPLEILTYLTAYIDSMIENGQLKVPIQQTLVYTNMATMNDVMTGTERISHTPLPLAYTIAISQITWIYIMLLPIQLVGVLEWAAIPATVFAAYIILSFVLIGSEIEDPFGYGVNDLPLDTYCLEITTDISIISSQKKPVPDKVMRSPENKLMFPTSSLPFAAWEQRSERVIREELKYRAETMIRSRYLRR